ncbi:MAG: hypothetical protein MUC81_02465 [Bacteroidia bacterium]|jgi:hypothetical protein|nr:hypothetical protein [Bacteroidia bacterium]
MNKPSKTQENIAAFLTQNPGSTIEEIIAGIGGTSLIINNSVKSMIKNEMIISTTGKIPKLTLVEPIAATETTDEATQDEDKQDENAKPKPYYITRHSSTYKFDGLQFKKGPLAVAVIKRYVEDHAPTFEQLKEIFPDDMVKYYGVFTIHSEAKKASLKYPRYFLKEDQIITLADKTKIAVTNQWTLANFEPFVKIARKLGYKIK